MSRSLVLVAAWFLFWSLLCPPLAAAPDPRVVPIVGQVAASNSSPALDSFQDYLSALPVNQTARRGYDADQVAQADLVYSRKVIYDELVHSLGRNQVSLQKFDADGYSGVNIIGVLPGRGPRRNLQYVINAHYDSVQNPGADDNASGVAGLLEAARVLGRHHFEATLVFLATDQEEEEGRHNGWGRGSQIFTILAKANQAPIQAVIALDMIAYNHLESNKVTISRVDSEAGSASARLSDQVVQAFRDYTLLQPYTLTGESESDPYFFYGGGYPALLVSEPLDSEGELYNPYYHSSKDFYRTDSGRPQQIDGHPYIEVDFAQQVIRAVVGWAAGVAGLAD